MVASSVMPLTVGVKCAIVGRAGQLHHGRQAKWFCAFPDLAFGAFRFEICNGDLIADFGLQVVGRPGVQGDFVVL